MWEMIPEKDPKEECPTNEVESDQHCGIEVTLQIHCALPHTKR